MRPFAARATVLLLSAALLTACSAESGDGGGGGGSAKEPAIGTVTKLVSATGLSFPLDGYETTDEQRRKLDRAQAQVTSDCMKRFGFTFELPVSLSPAGTGGESLRYGLTDPKTAERYGYTAHRGAASPSKPAAKSLGASGQLALHGPDSTMAGRPMSLEESRAKDSGKTVNGQKVPIGGCLREGYLTVYAPKKGALDSMFVTNMAMDANSRSREDSRVVTAVKAWSACMAEKGYKADEPVSPQADLGLKPNDYGSPKGIAAARQDVACKERANLVGVWYAVEGAYQKRNIEQYAEALKQAKTELDERLRFAATLAG
ncbi:MULTISPECIES: hypothetical protein [unclassified Streptomyces]|uniref:hypothetical protein n=1 Tax=unclassified Streptomyces TaxID=2593676 RepID=UPI001661338E|nr:MULTISPECIES: hypothetical protein [unclassified Streptomyces]MBD0707178.1 hypothetical protein [Streptomyces sp. CBMA291]MBD0713666.1 hypothetical protein [Streptomyces sp. CBMA370]